MFQKGFQNLVAKINNFSFRVNKHDILSPPNILHVNRSEQKNNIDKKHHPQGAYKHWNNICSYTMHALHFVSSTVK